MEQLAFPFVNKLSTDEDSKGAEIFSYDLPNNPKEVVSE